MSTDIGTIAPTNSSDSIDAVTFRRDQRPHMQLTQGLGLGPHDAGFIAFDKEQAREIITLLTEWVNE